MSRLTRRAFRLLHWAPAVVAGVGAVLMAPLAALSGEAIVWGIDMTLVLLAVSSFMAVRAATGGNDVTVDGRGLRLSSRALTTDLVIPWNQIAAVGNYRGQAVSNRFAASLDPLGLGQTRAVEFVEPRRIASARRLSSRLWRVMYVESGPTTAVAMPERGVTVSHLLFTVPEDAMADFDRRTGDAVANSCTTPGAVRERSAPWVYRLSWWSHMAMLAAPIAVGAAVAHPTPLRVLPAAGLLALSVPLFRFSPDE